MKDQSRNDWKLERLIAFLLSLLFLLPFVARGAETGNAPRLYLLTPDSGEMVAATLLTTELHATADGSGSDATLSQLFVNETSDCIEGVYVITLPKGSAIENFATTSGGVTTSTDIQSLQGVSGSSSARFRKASSTGAVTIFEIPVLDLPPGREVVVDITWSEPSADAGAALRMPGTAEPLYVRTSLRRTVAVPEEAAVPQQRSSHPRG